ncbi:MAG: TIGR04211 family SH3 domain-containing protein [Proteobacteria bacterium]|nr:TIGR04211 family SH3 domain-containing protein [Pseudomonadota bacterium]
MKRTLFACTFLLLFSATGFAETMYIHEVLKITLRTGPGTDHKILSMIESGQNVNIIEKGEEWSKVRLLSSGKEGWVLNRFLTDKIPTAMQLKALESNHQKLTEKYESLVEKAESYKTENTNLQTELSEIKKQFEEISNAHESLKKGSADYFKLKTSYEKSSKQLVEQTSTMEILKEKLQQKYLSFFAFGAGVLLLGIIIGIIFKSGRKQSSLY